MQLLILNLLWLLTFFNHITWAHLGSLKGSCAGREFLLAPTSPYPIHTSRLSLISLREKLTLQISWLPIASFTSPGVRSSFPHQVFYPTGKQTLLQPQAQNIHSPDPVPFKRWCWGPLPFPSVTELGPKSFLTPWVSINRNVYYKFTGFETLATSAIEDRALKLRSFHKNMWLC